MSQYIRYQPIALGGGGGGGIQSINGDTTAAQTLVVASTGTDFTIATVAGVSTFAIPSSSAANRGLLTAADWTTFNNKQSALTFGNLTSSPTTNLVVTGGTGAVIGAGTTLTLTGASIVEATSSVLTITGAANAVLGTGVSIQVKQAATAQDGYLSATDWNTFNGKQAAGNYITALTGDASASGPGSAALTLATVNSNVGSFGGATAVGTFTVNAKGLITAASSTSIQIAESQVTNLVSDLAGKQPIGNYITALTGDGAASGPGSAAFTLATVNSNVGTFTNATITVNAKGLITAASNGAGAVTGDLTDTGTDGIVITGGTGAVNGTGTSIAQHVADSTHNGYLSSTDWSTFNGKQAAGNYITALTGDVSASGPGSSAATLATVNSNVGSFSNANVTVNAKGLVTAASNPGVTAKTTTYAILTTDNIILCSGSAFTVTLPTAVGATGKQYTIKKTDSSLTNIITIATTSSQTIDGVTSKKLSTQYELFTVVSDGANWQILDHSYNTAWNNNFTFSVDGTGASATNMWSRRVGDSLEIQGTITVTSTSAVTSAIALPTGIAVDSAKMPSLANTSLIGFMEQLGHGATNYDFAVGNIGGVLANTGSVLSAVFYDGSTTNKLFIARTDSTAAFNKENSNSFINVASTVISFTNIVFPVSGWEG